MSVLSRPEFHDEVAAFAHLESIVWADGGVCPHCGALDRLTKVTANPVKRIREGLWRCGHCKGQFTAKIGTVFEHARIPLHKMLQVVFLMTSSKKGISAHQIGRVLEITYKSAWFLCHRIREAMRSTDLSPFGGEGAIVEVDETFIGHDKKAKPKGEKKGRGYAHKYKVLALVDRNTGKARAMVVDSLKAKDLTPILEANIAAETHVMTDEAGQYYHLSNSFAGHDFTSHGKGDRSKKHGKLSNRGKSTFDYQHHSAISLYRRYIEF